jgi:hypothetical protein
MAFGIIVSKAHRTIANEIKTKTISKVSNYLFVLRVVFIDIKIVVSVLPREKYFCLKIR